MTDIDTTAGKVLRYGTFFAFIVVTIGAVIGTITGFSPDGAGELIIKMGIGFMIAVPLIAVIVVAYCLYKEKDYRWMYAACILVLASVIGLIISYYIS